MRVDEFERYTESCFQGASAPCMSVCPLKVDVRAVIEKVQRGDFTAAYRLYRNQVVFPRIVSAICHQPCKSVCVRNPFGEAIDLRLIERACVELTKDREPIRFNVPLKKHGIAVIGGGLSGMACALKLAGRNYEVTVYERQELPGGKLQELLPQEIYLSEFENELKGVTYQLITGREILSLDEIQADAVYVATGAGGRTFGLEDEMDLNSLGTKKQGVFLGGRVIDAASSIHAIEHGVRVSHSIEKYLKVGRMDGVPETYQERPIEKKYYSLPIDAQGSPQHSQWENSGEEAIGEAKRCLKCDCNLCVNNCDLMLKFKTNPKRIVHDVQVTMRPMEKFSKRIASRLINSCNQCGLCQSICPEHIDMEDCLRQARYFLHRDGAMPEAYHEFWLRDMDFANSQQACTFIPPENGEKPRYLFFPGCQLGASEENYVLKSYEALKKIESQTALLLGCCGVPADWAGDEELRQGVQTGILEKWKAHGEPTLILACPTCMKTFSRCMPQIKFLSLYEVFARQLPPHDPGGEMGTVAVFDPCASRDYPQMQESVRKLLCQAGFQIEELPYQGKHARCCSYGGQIHGANPKQVKDITLNRIGENPNSYVTYCSNCRDTFASEGKESSHILDVIFQIGNSRRSAPDLSQRRRNRISLVSQLTGDGTGTGRGSGESMSEGVTLEISPELKKYMNDHLILEEDVQAVIQHCEATGSVLQNKSTGEFTGHLSQGATTYWVTYEKGESGYRLKKVYYHRMVIEEKLL